jgi:hypothetical protein
MRDRIRSRKEFLCEDSAARLRLLAANVATIGDRFFDGTDLAVVREAIDDGTWMIEWAVPEESPDVQRLLVELQKLLYSWRTGLESFGSDWFAREVAGKRAHVWAEHLQLLAGLLGRKR